MIGSKKEKRRGEKMIWLWTTIAMATTIEHANSVVGVWSEFGCTKDQVILKNNDKVTMQLWAGDEYGWLHEYQFWSLDGGALTIRERRSKNSQVVEQWIIETVKKDALEVRRGKVNQFKDESQQLRTIHLTRCQ